MNETETIDPTPAEPPVEADRTPEEQDDAEAIGAICGRWLAEAEQLQKHVPAFSLAEALNDQRFCSLLCAGTDVRTAYGALHLDELCAAAVREAEQRLEDRLRQNTLRPEENGIAPPGARAYGGDAARLTNHDLADICRRVAGGERISFGG